MCYLHLEVLDDFPSKYFDDTGGNYRFYGKGKRASYNRRFECDNFPGDSSKTNMSGDTTGFCCCNRCPIYPCYLIRHYRLLCQ